MDGLRWWLLLFGLLVVAGVYIYSRREKTNSEDELRSSARVEPRLDGHDDTDDPLDASPHIDTDENDENDEGEVDPEPPATQKIVTVRLVAREKKFFAGDELVLCMRGIGLRHGKFGIFHRYDGNDEGETVFSAASLIEPGSFDLQNIKGQEIPGISLFLVLPGPIDCVEAFDMMLAAARAMTQSLNGELLDESGSTLSIQRERYLREEIIQFQHSSSVS
jgi:cell division protein ZipA